MGLQLRKSVSREDAVREAAPSPQRLMELSWAFAPAHALSSALDLGLFTQIAEGKTSLPALEQAVGASRRGLAMLLHAMVAIGLLTRKGAGEKAHYGLAPDSDAFLVAGRPGYLGDFILLHVEELGRNWAHLTECIRTGEPVVAADTPEQGVALWEKLVDPLFAVNCAAAWRLAEEIDRIYAGEPLRLLDVAAGSGVWGIAAAQRSPATRVVAFDLPETLPHTRRNARRHQVADRFEFSPGDIRTDDFGSPEFDVAVLGHICHSEGAEHTRRLLAKVGRAMKAGGLIAIAEFLPDEGRSGPPLPLLFALNMLVHTREGDTFTFSEFAAWLKEAGFDDVRPLETPSPSPLILATRS